MCVIVTVVISYAIGSEARFWCLVYHKRHMNPVDTDSTIVRYKSQNAGAFDEKVKQQ